MAQSDQDEISDHDEIPEEMQALLNACGCGICGSPPRASERIARLEAALRGVQSLRLETLPRPRADVESRILACERRVAAVVVAIESVLASADRALEDE